MHVAPSYLNPMTAIAAEPANSQVIKAHAKESGFGFDDFLDIINPLQHLPLVGMIYRAVTDDHIEAPAKIAGGALFGGLYGFLGALGSVAFEEITGDSIEQTILSWFDDKQTGSPVTAANAYRSAQLLSIDDIERAALVSAEKTSPLQLAAN